MPIDDDEVPGMPRPSAAQKSAAFSLAHGSIQNIREEEQHQNRTSSFNKVYDNDDTINADATNPKNLDNSKPSIFSVASSVARHNVPGAGMDSKLPPMGDEDDSQIVTNMVHASNMDFFHG